LIGEKTSSNQVIGSSLSNAMSQGNKLGEKVPCKVFRVRQAKNKKKRKMGRDQEGGAGLKCGGNFEKGGGKGRDRKRKLIRKGT